MNWGVCCPFPDHTLRLASGLSWTLHHSLIPLEPSLSLSPCSEGVELCTHPLRCWHCSGSLSPTHRHDRELLQ